MDAHSPDVKGEGWAKRDGSGQSGHPERGGKECVPALGLGLAEDFFGDIRGDGDAEAFTLVGLDHQENPENQPDELNKAKEREAKGEPGPLTGKEAQPKERAEDNAQDLQAAENDDGLGSVKADGRALVNEIKDQAGYPAQSVAEQAGDIFLKTRLRA
jgi:hypothetical protein